MNELPSKDMMQQKYPSLSPSLYKTDYIKRQSSKKGLSRWRKRLQMGLFTFLGGVYLGGVIYYLGTLIKPSLESLYLNTVATVFRSTSPEVPLSTIYSPLPKVQQQADVKTETVSNDTVPRSSIKTQKSKNLVTDQSPSASPLVVFSPHQSQKVSPQLKKSLPILSILPTLPSKKISITPNTPAISASQSSITLKKNKPKKIIQKSLAKSGKKIKNKLNRKKQAVRRVDQKKSPKKTNKPVKKSSNNAYQSLEQSLGVDLLP